MCRMIAAVGRFRTEPLIAALRAMALNTNPAYDHELRVEGGDLVHDCGWGVAYVRDGKLERHRSAAPCFEDPALESLAGVRSQLVMLHARRTKDRATISEVNAHPFLASFGGEEWAFCHNGEVRDLSQLSHHGTLTPQGTIDSELLFLHLLPLLDRGDPARSVAEVLGGITDFTSLNCFLLRRRSLVAFARRDPGSLRPRYYTLWRGRGPGLDVVASEVVAGLDVEWGAIPDGQAVEITP